MDVGKESHGNSKARLSAGLSEVVASGIARNGQMQVALGGPVGILAQQHMHQRCKKEEERCGNSIQRGQQPSFDHTAIILRRQPHFT